MLSRHYAITRHADGQTFDKSHEWYDHDFKISSLTWQVARIRTDRLIPHNTKDCTVSTVNVCMVL